jgi:hypothetical protein
LDDIYRDVSYNLDEDTFAEAEDLDIVRKRFIRAWEQLVDGYRVCLLSTCLLPCLPGRHDKPWKIAALTYRIH